MRRCAFRYQVPHSTEQRGTMATSSLLHAPNLDTILMAERAIKGSDDYPTRMQLWRSLPKKMQYQTFKTILNCLEASSKIMLDGHGHIIWTAPDGQKLRDLLASGVVLADQRYLNTLSYSLCVLKKSRILTTACDLPPSKGGVARLLSRKLPTAEACGLSPSLSLRRHSQRHRRIGDMA